MPFFHQCIIKIFVFWVLTSTRDAISFKYIGPLLETFAVEVCSHQIKILINNTYYKYIRNNHSKNDSYPSFVRICVCVVFYKMILTHSKILCVCVMFFYSDGIYSSFSLDRRTIACPLLQLMGVTRSVFVGGYEHVCPNTKARLRGSAPSSPFWLASSSTILNVMWSNKNEKNHFSWIWYQCRYLLFIWSVRHYLDSICAERINAARGVEHF